MNEEDILKILKSNKRMEIYLCEADLIREFCKIATFFNLQIVSFMMSRLCTDSGLKARDVSEMVIEVWERNMERTMDITVKSLKGSSQEESEQIFKEAKRLAKEYIISKLDIAPSAEDLNGMFKDL